MNDWIKKYLDFYNADLTKTKSTGNIKISKLNGSKTNLKITININTLHSVLSAKYRDDASVKFRLSDDKELLSISSDDKDFLEDIMFEYGGYLDDSDPFSQHLKYTLQLFKFYVKDEITASI
jgi:hypothetical protein